jgi:hypothetical protein
MGEIKSTLDIIMEKTKGLTMTDEEKKAFQKKEIEGKARGLLQKFLDSYIDLKGLKKEIAGLDEKRQIMIKEALRREGLARVKLDADNTKLFDLLENTVGFETAPIRKILSGFSKELERMRTDRENRGLEILAERGISGSAIIPNVNTHPEWIEYVSEVKQKLKTRIDGAIQET